MTAPRTPSKSLRWLSWSSVAFGAQGLAQLVLMAFLARELSLAENGVVMAVLVVSGLVRAMEQALISPVLVQTEALSDRLVRSAGAISLLWAAALSGLLWISAPWIEAFFAMEGLTLLLRALVPAVILAAVGFVSEGLLHRELRLRALAGAELLGYFGGYLPAGIAVALAGHGPWTIVAAVTGHAALRAVALIALRRPPWALVPDAASAREILFFGGGILSARLFGYAASRADYVVVGRVMNETALGVYGRAYELMAMPAMFLGEVVDRVLFPLMSRYQNDRERLATTYGRGISLVCMIMLPASIGGIVLAPELTSLVLGPGWDAVVLPFQVLMAGLVFRTGYKLGDSLARSTGTVYQRSWRQLLYASMVVVGTWIGTGWGVNGVAWGVLAALAGNYLSMAWLSLKTTGMGWGRFLSLHARGLVTGIGFLAVSQLLASLARSAELPRLVVVGLTAAASLSLYGLCVWRAPGLLLGADGRWLIDKLTGRRSG